MGSGCLSFGPFSVITVSLCDRRIASAAAKGQKVLSCLDVCRGKSGPLFSPSISFFYLSSTSQSSVSPRSPRHLSHQNLMTKQKSRAPMLLAALHQSLPDGRLPPKSWVHVATGRDGGEDEYADPCTRTVGLDRCQGGLCCVCDNSEIYIFFQHPTRKCKREGRTAEGLVAYKPKRHHSVTAAQVFW